MKPLLKDFVIIGSGPAGLNAAITAANLGAQVTIIDENTQIGGQIFRQHPPEISRTKYLDKQSEDTFEKLNENTFEATATNQIGPMNATFSGTINLSNIIENKSYRLSGEGQSSVGFANGSADVKLEELNNVTTLFYDVDLNVGGKIAQLGSRLIDGVAKKMSDYFLDVLQILFPLL